VFLIIKTIIIMALTLVGYEMIIANTAHLIGYLPSHIQCTLVFEWNRGRSVKTIISIFLLFLQSLTDEQVALKQTLKAKRSLLVSQN